VEKSVTPHHRWERIYPPRLRAPGSAEHMGCHRHWVVCELTEWPQVKALPWQRVKACPLSRHGK
jgi:hypothetical protein